MNTTLTQFLRPKNIASIRNTLSIFIIPAILLYGFSLWVPLVDDFYLLQRNGNLFHQVQPRAMLGTIANLFNWGDRELSFLKVSALYGWLCLIALQIQKNLLKKSDQFKPQQYFILISLCFIFSFSTISQITFGKVKIFDSIPYFLILSSYVLAFYKDAKFSFLKLSSSTLLLTCAVLFHEKSLFDIAILIIFISWRDGLKRTIIFFGPAIVLISSFLFLAHSRSTTGLPPRAYFEILTGGMTFFYTYSFNIYGILCGGGALWILYGLFSASFVRISTSIRDTLSRSTLSLVLLLLCLLPLLVAWDVSRLTSLIWLPSILLMEQISLMAIFATSLLRSVLLAILCIIQFLIPPMFWLPNKGAVAFNHYTQWLFSNQYIVDQKPIHKGDILFFGNRGNGTSYLREGWHSLEPWGVWQATTDAQIELLFVDPNIKNITMIVKAIPTSKSNPSSYGIVINDALVKEYAPDNPHDYVIQLQIPQNILPKNNSEGSYSIKIRANKITSPKELGISSDDTRPLGLGLKQIEFQ